MLKYFLFIAALFMASMVGAQNAPTPKETKELRTITDTLRIFTSKKLRVTPITYQKEVTLKIDTLSFMAVGDIMMGTDFPDASYLPEKGAYPFQKVDSVFRKTDILFGNLEGTLTDEGENAKHCKDPKKCYSFRSPEYLGSHLQRAGFDVMSIANNHIGDFGDVGISNTISTLDSLGIANAGVYDKTFTTFTKDSIKYGFCAFAPNTDTPKIQNYKKAIARVKMLKDSCDIVIVSFHGGAEGTDHLNVTRKTEKFYGEDRGNVYEFAHKMIDAGADIIFGHGPHITRAVEVYKNRFIAYSLGNFCTYKRFNLNGVKGYAPIVEVRTTKDGIFLEGKVHSAKQLDGVYPFMDKKEGALSEIKRLTAMDFPETGLIFTEDGYFRLPN
ncbi:CapA family protein [Sungkyunkwania multivorans]|uniref:CapA family protein n=1 Tax=Sungkyunkwania multivorans TaxID=1173618 RepID=A0ABW3D439_9FLAO